MRPPVQELQDLEKELRLEPELRPGPEGVEVEVEVAQVWRSFRRLPLVLRSHGLLTVLEKVLVPGPKA